MAFPTSMNVEFRGRYKPAGITVECYPSTVRGLRVEVQAATANSTATSVWSSHILPPSSAGVLRYTVPIPESTRLYYLKARHPAGNGYSNGPFTPTISARAKLTPNVIRPFVMQMSYQGNVETPSGSDVFVSSSKTIKVGTQPTTGTVTKIHRIRWEDGIPDTASQAYTNLTGFVATASTATIGLQAPVILPSGVKVTKFRIRSHKTITGDEILALFAKVNSTGGNTNLSTANNSGATGWVTTTGGAVSETISTSFNYYCRISLNPGTGSSGSPRFMHWEFIYTMPDYQKAI